MNTPKMTLDTLLNHTPSPHPRALIIGNGVNRFTPTHSQQGNGAINNAWDSMLVTLWRRHGQKAITRIPQGITLTEFYDALDLISQQDAKNLQQEFCDLMAQWQADEHHKAIVSWAQRHQTPILTTNFEETLSETLSLKLRHMQSKRFTDFYPWGSYFSTVQIQQPSTQFAIWHINGMQRYARSVRLGLSHYMGAVERARHILHQGHKKGSFNQQTLTTWLGSHTWLNIMVRNELVIIGLGLESNEVFLRWLLIERAKLFKALPHMARNAYYAHAGQPLSAGQQMFLKAVGVSVLPQDSYDALYLTPW